MTMQYDRPMLPGFIYIYKAPGHATTGMRYAVAGFITGRPFTFAIFYNRGDAVKFGEMMSDRYGMELLILPSAEEECVEYIVPANIG